MRVAEREVEVVAGLGGTVADALNLEALAEPFGDAFDHVGDQRPGQTVGRAVRLGFTVALDDDATAFDFHLDDRQNALLEFAFWPLDAHDRIGHLNGDFLGNRDRQFTNS